MKKYMKKIVSTVFFLSILGAYNETQAGRYERFKESMTKYGTAAKDTFQRWGSKIESKIPDNVKKGFGDFKDSVAKHGTAAKDTFERWGSKIESKIPDNVKKGFGDFKDSVTKHGTAAKDTFKRWGSKVTNKMDEWRGRMQDNKNKNK